MFVGEVYSTEIMQMWVYYTSCFNSANPCCYEDTRPLTHVPHTHTHTRTIIKCYLEIFPWLKREKEMPRRWQLIRLDVFVTQGRKKKEGRKKKNPGRLNVLVCVMREAAHVCAWACKPREGRRCSLKRPRQPSALNHPRSARRHQQRKHITRVVSPRLLLLSSLYYI